MPKRDRDVCEGASVGDPLRDTSLPQLVPMGNLYKLMQYPSVAVSAGKSTLLSQLTGTESEAAAYEFTTLTCIPGIIHYKGTKIQLLDLPGIIEGAAQGKGRGRQVCLTLSTCSLPSTHSNTSIQPVAIFSVHLDVCLSLIHI